LASVHGLALFAVKTQPVAGLQLSVVQELPSLQTIAACSHRPVDALQLSVVQELPSSQDGAGPPTQIPFAQVSLGVQALPSLQALVLFVNVHVEFTQESVVHGLPSLQPELAVHTETTLRHQPESDPPSGANGSSTQRFQVPFGFVPVNTDRADPPVGAAAASLKIRFTPVIAVLPPTSDRMSALPPVKCASSTSTSLAYECVNPLSSTVVEHR
jgi:hypothetical protein